ncbi:MAG: ATP-binding protein [Gammaproteobacteria bacterium]
MVASEFVKARLPLELKQRVKALSESQLLSESTWLKRLVVREVQAADGAKTEGFEIGVSACAKRPKEWVVPTMKNEKRKRQFVFSTHNANISGATLADLDLRRLKNYFAHVREQDVPADEDEAAWTTLLFNADLMAEDGITVAGILLFGRTPNRFLPQAGIDASAFPGLNKDYAARERSALRGPMTPLLSDANEIVEAGLVEQALAFTNRNIPVTGQLEEGGARREEVSAYPMEAVREAVVNALVHRDYLLSGTDIELSIYEDRMEIVSPGRLPNGITPPRMLTGCRAARNQLIKDVMRDYRYLEHSGMGVPRKIVKCMKEHNNTEPVLIEDGERFTVRLLR